MNNLQDLLNYVLPYAEQNCEPVEDITFRCFLHIERNAGLLTRYITLIVAKGATPHARQSVNSSIAQSIEKHLNLQNAGREVELPKGKYLINSYSVLEHK